jgi:homoserine dehydrogenase
MLGVGVVGSGVVELLTRHHDLYAHRAGRPLALGPVAVRDPAKVRECDVAGLDIGRDWRRVVEDPRVGVVVEVMGGLDPAVPAMRAAIEAGKHVVTANKEVMAKHGPALFDAAKARGVQIYFEGAVGGGIPLILPMKRSLAANAVRALAGIVNGTTNYILTEMAQRGREFAAALADAQARGYAEADPTADIDGYDAAYKLAILAAIAFGVRIDVDTVHREGIRGVTAADIAYARELGYAIKLLAVARRGTGGIEARVHPALVRAEHPLADVRGVFNALWIEGDAVGGVMFSGRGAGRLTTASAVVGDLLNCAADMAAGQPNRLMACLHTGDPVRVAPAVEAETGFYLRLHAEDRPGVIAAIGAAFAYSDISIESLLQKREVDGAAEIVMLTHPRRGGAMADAVHAIEAHPATRRVCALLRGADLRAQE